MAINTTKATLQMRRGNEADFDPDKMLPGEWAVSLDKKYVRMCFAPGLCIRMATYEGFEEDMKEIREILKKCQDIQVAVQKFVELAESHSKEAESWAHGRTGIREGENTDNSEYYSQQAKNAKEAAERARDEAQASTGIFIATTERVGVVKPDGTTVTVDEDGTLHAAEGVDIDIATLGKAGIVKPDGKTINISEDGTIYVDQEKIEDYVPGTIATFPVEGSPRTLYIDIETNIIYRWDVASSSYTRAGEGKENVAFLPYSEFPEKGEEEILYVDISSTEELKVYRWNGEEYVTAKSGGPDLNAISDKYDPEKSYEKGEYLIRDDILYKVLSDMAAGEWDESAIDPTTVGKELQDLNANMGKLSPIAGGSLKTYLQTNLASGQFIIFPFSQLTDNPTNVSVGFCLAVYDRTISAAAKVIAFSGSKIEVSEIVL